jgi:chemotaxis family two-component system sensor histidine kinase/response regulator PixL
MARVLIVDDQLAARMLLGSILSRAGFETLLAENGLEALELLHRHPEVELLITDLDMPEMDGLELLERLQLNCTLRKLVVSAQGSQTYAEQVGELGAERMLEKPFSGRRLTEAVQSLLS